MWQITILITDINRLDVKVGSGWWIDIWSNEHHKYNAQEWFKLWLCRRIPYISATIKLCLVWYHVSLNILSLATIDWIKFWIYTNLKTSQSQICNLYTLVILSLYTWEWQSNFLNFLIIFVIDEFYWFLYMKVNIAVIWYTIL